MLRRLAAIVLVFAGAVIGVRSDPVALVSVGDPWRYEAAFGEISDEWRRPNFDDHLWLMGGSGFGQSSFGENTLLSGLLRGSGTIRFRTTFVVTDVESIRSLILRCDWQGGFVAYVNGNEIARRSLPGIPGEPVLIETPGSVRYAGTAEEISVSDSRTWLRQGTNVLAIQAHPNLEEGLDVVLVPELLANFTRGPYLQSVLQDRATVLWRTPLPQGGQLEFGRSQRLDRVLTVPKALPAQELTLTGLEPGADYQYRVRSGTGPDAAVSPVYSFRTLPAAGDLDLVFFGDSGAGSAAQFRVAHQLAQAQADLIVHLGDVVYPNFSFGRTDARCLSVYRELLRTTPFYFAWGNHDLYAGTEPFLTAFRQPTNSVSAMDHLAEGTRPEFFYSLDAGDVHVAVLFWPYSYQYYMREGCSQLRWLEQDLAATRKPWKFLALHHPVNTSGIHRADDLNRNLIPDRMEVAQRLMPLAARYGVQLILSGHDHNYERFHPILGTHTIVTGGGGILLYPLTERDTNSATFQSRWHYTSVQVRGDMIRLKAVDGEGRVFDAQEWRRSPADSGDPDGDGLGSEAEAALGTRPDDPDTDGDGLSDGWEFLHNRDPRASDPDPPEVRLASFLSAPIPRPTAELSALPLVGGGVQLRWLASSGYRPEIESAPDPGEDWHRVVGPMNGAGKGAQSMDIPTDVSRRFFRVRLVPEQGSRQE